MKWPSGQAWASVFASSWRLRHWLRPAWWALHRLASFALALVVLAALVLGAGFWRLTEGPVNLAWVARRLEAAANRGAHPIVLHVGQAALVWEGWRAGVDRPIDLRLVDLVASDRAGHEIAEIPHAEVSLALHALLLGRLAPRAIALDIERLHLVRGADGAVSLFANEAPPAATPAISLVAGTGIDLDDLRRARVSSNEITITDQALGTIWRIAHARAELERRVGGAFAANLAATLSGARQNLPLRAEGVFRLGHDLAWRDGAGTVSLGASEIALADGLIPLAGARLNFTVSDPAHVRIDAGAVSFAGPGGGAGPVVSGSGEIRREANIWRLVLAARLDRLAFADLARYWPAGLAEDTREWLITNITAGTAYDGALTLSARLPADGQEKGLAIEQIGGTLAGDDLSVTWLSPLPQIVHGRAVLSFGGMAALDIAASAGEVSVPGGGTVTLSDGTIHIDGLDAADQHAAMRFTLAGNVADALALLANRRLHLLDQQHFVLRDPGGTFSGTLNLGLPLARDVRAEDVVVGAKVDVRNLHLAGLVGGRDLDGGALSLDIDNAGLRADGQVRLAGIAARIGARMDFTAGPPDQEVAQIALRARLGAADFAQLGLDPGGRVEGVIPLDAELIERRDGNGSVALSADLTQSALAPVPLGWRKPIGVAGHLSADLRLTHDHLASIDDITLQSDAALLLATADAAHGAPWHLVITRGDFGSSHFHGDLSFPNAGDTPYRLTLEGTSLDLSGRRVADMTAPGRAPRSLAAHEEQKAAAPGPGYVVNAGFDTILLGPRRQIDFLRLHAEEDGRLLTALSADGFDEGEGARGRFRVRLTRGARGERLVAASAEDAGSLLAALAGMDSIAGGRLSLDGRFDDARPSHPLAATLEITNFRLRDAPLALRVLQGATVYGLVGQKPGSSLAFDRLVAPFTYENEGISLYNARMSNASLGLTAKGSVDLAARALDLSGTVVPAYFFNSLLGRIPLIGRLFSPERGGGVLAANYTARGSFDDPKVSVNPLSALTPGFTRDIFNLFNSNK